MIEHRRQFTWREWCGFAHVKPASGWQRDGGDDWAGGSNKAALSMATGEGYQDAVPDAQALAEGLYDTVAAMVNLETFAQVFDVSGAEVDMGLFTQGVPECMSDAQPITIARSGRAIRIVVDFSYHCGIQEAVVRRRGAAVMALVYVLQQLQHPLEVWAQHSATGYGREPERLTHLVEVQRADEPVDIGRIMYALAHPTMLRRMCFRVEDHEPVAIRNAIGIPGGRGQPSDIRLDDLDEQAGHTILLPKLSSNSGWDVDSSVRWIEEQLSAIFDPE